MCFILYKGLLTWLLNCDKTPRWIQVRSLGLEDTLGKSMVTHPVFLPEESPWTEKPGRLHSIGWKSQTQLKRLTMLAHILYKKFGGKQPT